MKENLGKDERTTDDYLLLNDELTALPIKLALETTDARHRYSGPTPFIPFSDAFLSPLFPA